MSKKEQPLSLLNSVLLGGAIGFLSPYVVFLSGYAMASWQSSVNDLACVEYFSQNPLREFELSEDSGEEEVKAHAVRHCNL